MNKGKLLLLLLTILAFASCKNRVKEVAPTPWDLSTPAAQIKEIMSNDIAYYNDLVSRYYAHDTTLTFDEYALIYYGYEYLDRYNPVFENDSLNKYLTTNDFESALIEARRDYRNNPASLHGLFHLLNSCDLLGGTTAANLCAYKYEKIVNTILSKTGDAKSKDHAAKVLFINDIDQILRSVYGSTANDVTSIKDSISGSYHITTIVRDNKVKEEYYFDISSILRGINKMEDKAYAKNFAKFRDSLEVLNQEEIKERRIEMQKEGMVLQMGTTDNQE